MLPFIDPETSHAERAARAFTMQRAGFFSGGTEPIRADDEALDFYFDLVAAAVRPDNKLKSPTTIFWDFTDATPRHMRIDGANATVATGRTEGADVVFRTDLATWIGISGGFVQPGRALLTRKLRIKGSPMTLAKLTGVFQTPWTKRNHRGAGRLTYCADLPSASRFVSKAAHTLRPRAAPAPTGARCRHLPAAVCGRFRWCSCIRVGGRADHRRRPRLDRD
ncbi:MAG: SCP2 sterol-binding domain-containing protein [Solirubrobacterales bacterium]